MMKKMFIDLLFILLFFMGSLPISQVVYAQGEKNNIVGMHLLQPSDEDLRQTSDLVNSSGGDWGYVTLVIQENDRDHAKWQELFDKLRRLHLIPIIRLATSPQGEVWRRPQASDADSWVDFLDSLNWVVKNRYIILFNEPNQGREWGGWVDAESYAEVAFHFSRKLKKKSTDFFVMLAGFDASAPSKSPLFEDEGVFLKKIVAWSVSEQPQKIQDVTFFGAPGSSTLINFIDFIDGWASHSYPNHGFVGTPYDSGRTSIRTYQWELSLLKELGVKKRLPVFITETGWPHNQNKISKSKNKKSYYTPEKSADYIKIAYEEVWLRDARVRAVTTFVFNYPEAPFDVFSWKHPSEGLYPSYYTVQSFEKVKGTPIQRQSLMVEKNQESALQKELTTNSTYAFKIGLRNEGQAIIDAKDGYEMFITADTLSSITALFSDFSDFAPFSSQSVNFFMKTGDVKGDHRMKATLMKHKKIIQDLFMWDFTVTGPPSLQFGVQLFPRLSAEADTIAIQIFDSHEQMVFQKEQLKIKEGYGLINEVHNVALGDRYRIVILNPYYLPRQEHIVFRPDQNVVVFEKMFPVDFNQDGKFSFADWWFLVRHPSLLKLWWVR